MVVDDWEFLGLRVGEQPGDVRSLSSFISCTRDGEGGEAYIAEDEGTEGASVKSVWVTGLGSTMRRGGGRAVAVDIADAVDELEDDDIDDDFFRNSIEDSIWT